MALFQQSVLKKHIESLNTSIIDEKWKLFQSHFQNTIIQQNIRQLKEEQYQGEFLEDLFVKIFGYIKAPSPNFNIITEQKNITNSKKADGAIIVNEKALAVIELKGTDTTDLAKIESQAFGYKSNQPGCNYVITSNFEKLRFYIDNTTQFEEFNLFTLDKKSFELLYCCLDWESVSKNVPVNLLNQSVSKESAITKQLYKDYSDFKRSLFDNLVELNPQYDKLDLFKKTQKLLDRFLFIFFAEDRLLLPTNLIRRINQEWENLQKMRIPVSLYDRYKIYFNDLNEGATVTLPAFGKKTGEAIEETHDIFAYNGGLFKPDEFLDNLKIDDQLLYNYTLKLSDYDFQSEVDVNILGHIFENSLNEIDEIKSEIEGKEVDKTKTKRKKDGVFYTPKYITKYIVDNTVGKLCEEKKAEIKLVEEEYHTDKNLQTKTKKALLEKLTTYKEWLLQLTICDPACGSGAFLNQALEFLIAEHRYIDELQAKLMGDSLVLSDVETSILENNIYGVDLNDESIEIAKLSLWLRTAQKGRKLNSLNNNIKCGNSLIDDPEIAGDKAFSWEKEFPEVFTKGGFDVIIGNPPYVRKQGLMEHYPNMCKFYESKFISATANYDIYAIFMERTFELINDKGIISYILPHKFLVTDFGEGIRRYFKENVCVDSLIHFGSELVFADAATYTCIINLSKHKKEKVLFKKVNPNDLMTPFDWDYMYYKNLSSSNWDLQSEKVFDVIKKINKQPFKVENVFDKIFQGIATSLDDIYVFKGVLENGIVKAYNSKYDYHFEIEEGLVKPFIKGNQISRNCNLINSYYVIFPYQLNGDNSNSMSEDFIKSNYPKGYDYLKHFELEIKSRENGRMNIDQDWFLYIYPKSLTKFQYPKIMTQEISLGCNMTYDETGNFYHPTTIYSFVKNQKFKVDEKYYLGILNSKVMWFFLKNTGTELGGGYFRFKTNYLKPFPLPKIAENSQILIDKVNLQLSLNKDIQSVINKFSTYFFSQYNLEKLSGKLEKWYELSFADFIKELNKAIKGVKGTPLTKKDEFEWMDLFEENKKKALEIKAEIDKTDKEIDQMVYELYGLTEEEIKIVEGE